MSEARHDQGEQAFQLSRFLTHSRPVSQAWAVGAPAWLDCLLCEVLLSAQMFLVCGSGLRLSLLSMHHLWSRLIPGHMMACLSAGQEPQLLLALYDNCVVTTKPALHCYLV